GSSSAVTAAALLGVLATWALLIRGPRAVGKVGNLLAPVLVVITLGMLVLVFTRVSWGELIAAPPLNPMDNQHLAFMLAVEMNVAGGFAWWPMIDRKSTRLNSSHVSISYAVFCLKKKK